MVRADASATDHHANHITDTDPGAILATSDTATPLASASLGGNIDRERSRARCHGGHGGGLWGRFRRLGSLRSH